MDESRERRKFSLFSLYTRDYNLNLKFWLFSRIGTIVERGMHMFSNLRITPVAFISALLHFTNMHSESVRPNDLTFQCVFKAYVSLNMSMVG